MFWASGADTANLIFPTKLPTDQKKAPAQPPGLSINH
jgi:hypothetical protein